MRKISFIKTAGVSALLIFILSSFGYISNLEKISVDMVVKTLKKGKTITMNGEIYYKRQGGIMVMHYTSPIEYLVISNISGEIKIYDRQNNTIIQNQDPAYSSNNHFFYFFLSGKTQDMGLLSAGYTLKETRPDGKLIITVYNPPPISAAQIGYAEVVHENYKPVFLGFYDTKGNAKQKIYYTNYQNVSDVSIPMNTTEILFTAPADSVITRRLYSNLKTNNSVDNSYLNFKIPNDAKILR